jgi:predicted secreted hydrolase
MSSRPGLLIVFLSCVLLSAQQYRTASPGYDFQFPRDHFAHPEFKTEWWYYTGNLRSADGRRFGFELTFFRTGVNRRQPSDSAWTVTDIYHAHLALSDITARRFYHLERTNRAGPGLAGANQELRQIWNGNWRVQWTQQQQNLQAIGDHFVLNLAMIPQKFPVINGVNGVSQKSGSAGHGSHYISLTRLQTAGSLSVENRTYDVQGLAWMDHEFFSTDLDKDQVGWDWLYVQMEDNTELMLYHMRRNDGSEDPYSAGTYVDSEGRSRHLTFADFSLIPTGKTWRSRESGATYPVSWQIGVPSLGIKLEVMTELENQEITSRAGITPNYWEGAITVSGTRDSSSVAGIGYLEMTGYDKPLNLNRTDLPQASK